MHQPSSSRSSERGTLKNSMGDNAKCISSLDDGDRDWYMVDSRALVAKQHRGT